ncbi:MAG: hypothetical protein JWO69_634 [Thermoleophilia bacterium]|nr:hypothetical protein [Thermoleophilia bacterium]
MSQALPERTIEELGGALTMTGRRRAATAFVTQLMREATEPASAVAARRGTTLQAVVAQARAERLPVTHVKRPGGSGFDVLVPASFANARRGVELLGVPVTRQLVSRVGIGAALAGSVVGLGVMLSRPGEASNTTGAAQPPEAVAPKRVAAPAVPQVDELRDEVEGAGAATPQSTIALQALALVDATAVPDLADPLAVARAATAGHAELGAGGAPLTDAPSLEAWARSANAWTSVERRMPAPGELIGLDLAGDDIVVDTFGVVVAQRGDSTVVAHADGSSVQLRTYDTYDGRVLGYFDPVGAKLAAPRPASPLPAPPTAGTFTPGSLTPDQELTWPGTVGENACGIAAVLALLRSRGQDPDPAAMRRRRCRACRAPPRTAARSR